jgi:hypothetical protein
VSGWRSSSYRQVLLSSALCVLLFACIPDEGPAMRPGQNCMACHSATPEGSGGLPDGEHGHQASPYWSVAGTVFYANKTTAGFEGAEIQVTDANGWSFSLRSNEAGNFYSAESLTFPLHVCISANGTVSCQQSTLTSGACNSCHSATGSVGTPLTAP